MSETNHRLRRVAVIGASRGSGRQTVDALLARGHEVVAFARDVRGFSPVPRLRACQGDALSPEDVSRALVGCDAVIVTLGIPENALAVRLGLGRAPMDVRSRGTRHVIDAMRRASVRRLIVQTAYGIGASRGRLSVGWALAYALVLAPQIRDHEAQEAAVRASDLDWTLVQPVALVDEAPGPVEASVTGRARSMRVTRAQVAGVHADAVDGAFLHQVVAVSA